LIKSFSRSSSDPREMSALHRSLERSTSFFLLLTAKVIRILVRLDEVQTELGSIQPLSFQPKLERVEESSEWLPTRVPETQLQHFPKNVSADCSL
jgi:hypothetical protein